MENEKTCGKCRKTVAADSTFCEFCGEKITDAPIQEENRSKDVASPMYVVGTLENELRHIKEKIVNIEVNVFLTRLGVGIFFVLEIVSYLFFVGQLLLLVYSFTIDKSAILKALTININDVKWAVGNQILQVYLGLQLVWFCSSLITLAVGIFFTLVRKQGLKILRQNKIITTIVGHVNDMIEHLKTIG